MVSVPKISVFVSIRPGYGVSPVTFSYDGDGLLMQAGQPTAARDPASGRLTGTTLGGVTTTQGYNGSGELSALTATHGATGLYSSSYTRPRVATRIYTR